MVRVEIVRVGKVGGEDVGLGGHLGTVAEKPVSGVEKKIELHV